MFDTALDKLKYLLGRRASNYRHLFGKDNPAAYEVLVDLAAFCRANESTFHPDPRIHAMLEGRREVWLRIQSHLKLNDDELARLRIEALSRKDA